VATRSATAGLHSLSAIWLRRSAVSSPDRQCLAPTASQFVEQLFIKRLAAIARPHRHEDVASDELVDHLAVGRQTLEGELLVLEGHVELLELPVDGPRLHR